MHVRVTWLQFDPTSARRSQASNVDLKRVTLGRLSAVIYNLKYRASQELAMNEQRT